jgi:lipopolysaccharide/colanic/teichoic acid biosynthesis glycosyltransferase
MSRHAEARSLRYLDSPARRVADIALASVALLVLAPLLLVIAGLVLVFDGAPVLFRQDRIGRHGATFPLLKFRTMRAPTDPVVELLDGGTRITRLGELLRRTSIDELPALLNILRGDMSVVGPRPLLALHVPLYERSHPERLLARPGLTGLAQVSGRKQATFSQRLDLDVAYVRTARPLQDVRIMLRTVLTVLRSVQSPSEGHIADVDDIGLAAAIRGAIPLVRWEHGSFLQPHGPVGSEADVDAVSDALAMGVLFGTARQALVAFTSSASRIHLPSYYCPDVVDTLRATVVADVVTYPDHPDAGPSELRVGPDELVVVLPHFGRPTHVSVDGGRLLIDATHTFGRGGLGLTTDASGRLADLCLASLRKTLPLPDGALVWSPSGGELPAAPAFSAAHAIAARRLDDALRAKGALLDGERADKPEVLRELVAAVGALEAIAEPSAALHETLARLATFDLDARWAARAANRRAATERLSALGTLDDGRLRLLEAPFMLILVASTSEVRERLRTGLIARDVYPAVLWSHDHLPAGSPERDFGARMLALHVDARYSPADLVRVADEVHAVLTEQADGR